MAERRTIDLLLAKIPDLQNVLAKERKRNKDLE